MLTCLLLFIGVCALLADGRAYHARQSRKRAAPIPARRGNERDANRYLTQR